MTGVDRDEGHVEYASRTVAAHGVDCRFVAGDALWLPFADDSFDACTSHTVMEHIEPDGFLREQWRVLRPGGVVSVLSVRTGPGPTPEHWLPAGGEEARLFRRVWQAAHRADRRHNVAAHALEAQAVPAALQRAGFTGVDVDAIALTWYAPDNAGVGTDQAVV